jgi:hypothetical protein
MRRICEQLAALHKHVVEQEIELEDTRKRLTAAGRMVSGARDQAAVVRGALGAEVAAHRVTKQKVDEEHELRIAAEEELRRVAESCARDGERLSRAMRLLAQFSDRETLLRRRRAGAMPDRGPGPGFVSGRGLMVMSTGVSVATRGCPVVDTPFDPSGEDDEKTIVDVPVDPQAADRELGGGLITCTARCSTGRER